MLEANSGARTETDRSRGEATLPLLAPRDRQDSPTATWTRSEWSTFAGWMRDNELIESLPTPAELLTNAYLPGEIPE